MEQNGASQCNESTRHWMTMGIIVFVLLMAQLYDPLLPK